MSELFALPAKELVGRLRKGDVSLEAYLDYLEVRYEQWEPKIKAFVEEKNRFERLRDEAQELDERYPLVDQRPPLFGLLIAVKDIFHVDGFLTRAGSSVPPRRLEGQEAQSVSIMREAGALIMGKSVTTEFAYFAPGPTRNPHDLNRTPGGSSSGSAAAVAAGLCPIATGTQTIGSITRPASYCGVVGYKPSYDRISRKGVIPLSESLDHVGLFSQDVSGLQLVAGLIGSQWRSVTLRRKPTLGIPDGPYLGYVSGEGIEHFNSVCERLQGAGYPIRRYETMPDFDDIVARHKMIMAKEAADTHRQWFNEFGDKYHPRTLELIENGRSVTVDDFKEALAGRERLRRTLLDQMDEAGIDIWLSPGAPGPAPMGLDSTGDPIMNLPWTHSGLPTVCLPSGIGASGLPLGIQLAGRWYDDEMLIAWSEELEMTLGQRPAVD